MGKDLFYMVMEAEGDLVEPMDDAPPVDDAPVSDPPAGSDTSGDPPPLNDTGDDMFSGDDDSMFGDTTGGDQSGDNTENADAEKDDKISDKANNILNQKLYSQICDRNSEVEEIIGNLQQITPILPYDVVKANDVHLSKLKAALLKGQSYVINDFVDSKYGENVMFYQKLDALYQLLLNSIDSNLKKVKNN